MFRFLCAFTAAVAAASPVLAQLPPALPAPRSAAHWVLGGEANGDQLYFDATSIGIDGYYRSADFLVQQAGGARQMAILQFDCDGGLYRFMTLEGGKRTAAGDWIAFDESRSERGVTVGSSTREALCSYPVGR